MSQKSESRVEKLAEQLVTTLMNFSSQAKEAGTPLDAGEVIASIIKFVGDVTLAVGDISKVNPLDIAGIITTRLVVYVATRQLSISKSGGVGEKGESKN